MKSTPPRGFTWIEVVVAILVIGVLLSLTHTHCGGPGLTKGQMAQTLNNMKQLHLATQQMTLDNQTTGESSVRWTCDGTNPISFDQWHKLLVPAYLSEKDFQRLLSASEKGFWGTHRLEDALTVFAVCESDAPDTVFLATKNWHPGASELSGKPYETKGFVLFHKGGDGAILQAWQANDTYIIGSGGMHHFLPLK